jgi:hypothetical protein
MGAFADMNPGTFGVPLVARDLLTQIAAVPRAPIFGVLDTHTGLRSGPLRAYSFENDAYSITPGLGIGQVIRRGRAVFNVLVAPQTSTAYRGPGQPPRQIFARFTVQFLQQRQILIHPGQCRAWRNANPDDRSATHTRLRSAVGRHCAKPWLLVSVY